MTLHRPLKVAIFWLNFGPYHVARLQSLAEVVDLTAIELVRGKTNHQWDIDDQSVNFRWESLYRDVQYDQIDHEDFRQRIDWCLSQNEPDVVIIPGYSPYFPRYLIKWAVKHRKIRILMIDSNQFDKKRYWPLELIKRWQLRKFHAAVVAGETSHDYMRHLGMPEKSLFIGYDVVDNTRFCAGADVARKKPDFFRQKLQLPEQYFLIVARFVHQKNFDNILSGYRRYHAETPNPWPLVICGDGEDRNWMQSYVADMPDVHLRHFVQIEDLVHYYGLATAFVLLSRWETWGLVVNEAMAAGLPLILSSSVACWHDLLQIDKNGLLVEDFQNPDEIAAAFKAMSDLPDTTRHAMGQASRAIIANWPLSRFRDAVMEAIRYVTH